MSNRHNARKAAVQALYQWDVARQEADEIEDSFRQIHDLQNVDRKYLKTVLKEVPQLEDELRAIISSHIDRDFDALDPVERAILRVGAYELKYRSDIPVNVVINETIEIAKIFGSEHSYKYVNGVMDKIAADLRKAGTG